MNQMINVTMEFITSHKSAEVKEAEGLMALGAALQSVSRVEDLAKQFGVPADVPVQLEVRHLLHPAPKGQDKEQPASPLLRISIDAPRQHADQMRAALERGPVDAIEKALSGAQPVAQSFAGLRLPADKPANLEIVFK